MLEVMGLTLTGAEVKKETNSVPKNVEVDITITKMTKKDAENVVLDFDYVVKYLPKTAHLKISGIAYCRDNPPNLKKAMAAFKKSKRIPMEYGATVINMINANAGLNSIFLIRPFNLLPPFMPPLISNELEGKGKKKQ